MNSILVFTYPLSAIIIFSVAIGLGILLKRKYNLGWRLYFIGATLFILSQVLHIPFNLLIGRLFPIEDWHPIPTALFFGLSAGLFEELIRYGGLRWWAKDARSWAKGLLFGSGWGGIEAILVGGLLVLTYINMTILRAGEITSLVPPDQLAAVQETVSAYWSIEWYLSMLGAVERILTIPIQIALTILVLQVFIRGQLRWLLFAILWHTLIDAAVVYAVRLIDPVATEGILALFTIASLGMIFALRGDEPENEVEENDEEGETQSGKVELPPIEETKENIEQTRFSS